MHYYNITLFQYYDEQLIVQYSKTNYFAFIYDKNNTFILVL